MEEKKKRFIDFRVRFELYSYSFFCLLDISLIKNNFYNQKIPPVQTQRNMKPLRSSKQTEKRAILDVPAPLKTEN